MQKTVLAALFVGFAMQPVQAATVLFEHKVLEDPEVAPFSFSLYQDIQPGDTIRTIVTFEDGVDISTRGSFFDVTRFEVMAGGDVVDVLSLGGGSLNRFFGTSFRPDINSLPVSAVEFEISQNFISPAFDGFGGLSFDPFSSNDLTNFSISSLVFGSDLQNLAGVTEIDVTLIALMEPGFFIERSTNFGDFQDVLFAPFVSVELVPDDFGFSVVPLPAGILLLGSGLGALLLAGAARPRRRGQADL